MTNDLVVVVPGIMGSALYRGDTPIWDLSLGGLTQALKTLGGSIRGLTLPEGVGDNPPDDGIRADHLIHDLHVIPGLWAPIRGYDRLVQRLRKIGFSEDKGNLLELPYDWRASVRYVVDAEAPKIQAALARWRSQRPENASAKIVFIAHSLGGLVARRYAVTYPDVSKVITIGTPSRGSMKAVEVLTYGVGPRWPWLQDIIGPLAASLPGLHQTLPAFPCVDTDGNHRHFGRITAQPIRDLDMSMTTAGVEFLDELAALESQDSAFLKRTHPLIGWGQPTFSSVKVTNGEATLLSTYGDLAISGDGTVTHAGAVPKSLPLDTPLVHGFPDQHGNLQANDDVLSEVTRILLEAPPVVLMGDRIAASLAMPELVSEGDHLVVTASIPPEERTALAVILDPGTRNAVERRPSLRDGVGQVSFPDISPGVHTVLVTGVSPGSPIKPVTGTLTAWSRNWEIG
jgi:pimeloyl-ACP methyl ester carboxylesterase